MRLLFKYLISAGQICFENVMLCHLKPDPDKIDQILQDWGN